MNMEDLLSGLVQQTSVCAERAEADDGNAAMAEHPRFSDQYKNEGKVAEQQRQRRQEHMERQNSAREEWLQRGRNIEEAGAGEDSQSQNNAFAPRHQHRGRWSRNPYVNMLMFSDWLVDIPCTLSTEWTLVPSPIGRRALVVAKRGITNVYFKNGHLATHFQSPLPGGNQSSKQSLTILDCIYDGIRKKIYILDLLWWKKNMYTDMDFTMRRFFLQSRVEELEAEKGATPRNCELVALPSCACTPEAIEEFMRSEFPYELDGLLFYYNSAFYLPEQTPLVGWLKPWMLPEILDVPVPERYMAGLKHANTREFIEEFNQTHRHVSSAQKQQAAEEEEQKKVADAPMDENEQREEEDGQIVTP